jgi:hypothetical protein
MHFNIKMNRLVKIIRKKPIINQKARKKEKENLVLHQKRKIKKDKTADREDKEVVTESKYIMILERKSKEIMVMIEIVKKRRRNIQIVHLTTAIKVISLTIHNRFKNWLK